MSKRVFILSIGYWFSSRTLGLLVHPYITMRAIVREKFMRPLVLLPLLLWIVGWVVGEMLIQVPKFILIGGVWVGLIKELLVFLFVWGSVFLLVWQVLLLYLFRRFLKVL